MEFICVWNKPFARFLDKAVKVSTPDSSLEHPSSWRGEHIPLLLPSEMFAPCPSHKPWRHPECSFQVGELLEEHSESPRRLYFPLSPSSSSRAYLQLPALPPACVWEPACHGLAASKRGERTAAGPTGKAPSPCAALPGPAIGRLQGFPVLSCRAAARPRHLFLRGPGRAPAAPAGPSGNRPGPERAGQGGGEER